MDRFVSFDFRTIILQICFAMFNSNVFPLGPKIYWPIMFL